MHLSGDIQPSTSAEIPGQVGRKVGHRDRFGGIPGQVGPEMGHRARRDRDFGTGIPVQVGLEMGHRAAVRRVCEGFGAA